MERRQIERSLQDEVFSQQLLADPRAIIERETGTRLPEDLRVVAVEETADTIYLVLPSTSPLERRQRPHGPGTRSGDRRRSWIDGHLLPVQFILRPELHVLIARSDGALPRCEEALHGLA